MSRFDLSDPGTMRLVVDRNYYLKFDASNHLIIAVNTDGSPVDNSFYFGITFFG